jgi:hypothetical protein
MNTREKNKYIKMKAKSEETLKKIKEGKAKEAMEYDRK